MGKPQLASAKRSKSIGTHLTGELTAARSRAFVNARIQTIYGGTTEIMKTIISKDLGI